MCRKNDLHLEIQDPIIFVAICSIRSKDENIKNVKGTIFGIRCLKLDSSFDSFFFFHFSHTRYNENYLILKLKVRLNFFGTFYSDF